jgi:hypothetical protein
VVNLRQSLDLPETKERVRAWKKEKKKKKQRKIIFTLRIITKNIEIK